MATAEPHRVCSPTCRGLARSAPTSPAYTWHRRERGPRPRTSTAGSRCARARTQTPVQPACAGARTRVPVTQTPPSARVLEAPPRTGVSAAPARGQVAAVAVCPLVGRVLLPVRAPSLPTAPQQSCSPCQPGPRLWEGLDGRGQSWESAQLPAPGGNEVLCLGGTSPVLLPDAGGGVSLWALSCSHWAGA